MTQTFSLDQVLGPISTDTFFSDYFEKQHCVIKRGDPSFFDGLLSHAEMDHVLTTMGLEVPEVNVTKAGANITAADFAYENAAIDPVRVAQLYADGATVIVSGLQERLPALARYCRALEAALSARVQTNIYMTPAGNQGFNPHYDSHDVLVLQVAGSKEWRIYGMPVELPLESQAFERGMEVGPEVDRFVLEPGDAVYVPRGLAHDAVATGEGSLHITTGLMFRTWADALAETVIAMAHREPSLRRALPPGFAQNGVDLETYAPQFAEMLGTLTDAPVGKLLGGFREEFLTGRVPRVEGQFAQLAALDGLSTDSQVGARPDVIYNLREEEDGQVTLIAQGAEIALPGHAAEAMAYCVTTPAFRLGDMGGDLDDDGKLVLARRLIREGLMMVHGVA